MRHRIVFFFVLLSMVACWDASASVRPVAASQAGEEEIARAFQMLGEILGLPEVPPEELKRRVEEVGELRFTRNVPIDFMTREELGEYIRRLFAEEYPPEVAEREERMLRAFGFLTEGQDLRTIREQVLNENIAGFYDERPQVKKLFAISSSGETLNLMNQLILSHELRHALQDQHVELREVLGEGSDFDDRKLAVLSLLEGDATLLMEKYLSSGMPGGEGDTVAGLLGMNAAGADSQALAEMFAGPELRGAPPVVREQLLVPYLEGRALAAAIFRRGGFRLLNQRLADPPRSMEQVLHPEKYLDQRDEPKELQLSEAIGESVESEGRLGEFLIRVLFQPGLARQDAIRAAAGWGGDRYALWQDREGKYRLVWHTAWDSEEDAEEFFQALQRFASLHYGSGPTPSAEAETVPLKGPDGSLSRIERRGREISLVREGFR